MSEKEKDTIEKTPQKPSKRVNLRDLFPTDKNMALAGVIAEMNTLGTIEVIGFSRESFVGVGSGIAGDVCYLVQGIDEKIHKFGANNLAKVEIKTGLQASMSEEIEKDFLTGSEGEYLRVYKNAFKRQTEQKEKKKEKY